MKRIAGVLLVVFVIFSLVQGALGMDVARAAEAYQWVPVNNGFYFDSPSCFAIDPTNTQVIYAAMGDGLYKSTDAGTNWTPTGLKAANISCLAVARTDTQVVYATASDATIVKSTDGGTKWSELASLGIYFNFCSFLDVDPTDAQVVYVSPQGGRGIFKSSDGGAHWTNLAGETGVLVAGLAGETICSFDIDPGNTNILYAGTSKNGALSKGVLFKSIDGGKEWTKSDTGLTCDSVTSLAIDASDTNTVYASTLVDGVFKSVDSGRNWTEIGKSLSGAHVFNEYLAIGPKGTITVYARTRDAGIYKSSDGGHSWRAENTGLLHYLRGGGNEITVTCVTVDPTNPDVLYTGIFQDGAYRTTDGGAKWTQIDNGFAPTPADVHSLAIDPKDARIVYAGTNNLGVFRSIDAGANWIRWSYPERWDGDTLFAVQYVWFLVIDPADTKVMYAGTDAGTFKSSDGGATWTQSVTSVSSLAIDPTNSQVLYATTGSAVIRSTDGGTKWTQRKSDNIPASSLAIDRANTQVIYAGTGTGVFKSIDGATTWVQSVITREAVKSLVISPTDTHVVYAGAGGSVIKSTDSRTTWAESKLAGLTSEAISSLVINPTNTQEVYAGTDRGVFKSTDGGSTWSAMNTGLGGHGVNCLVIDPTNTQVAYAATGHGIFKTVELRTYSITSTTGVGGSISPSGTITVNSGESKTFTVKPNSGYKISVVKVDGASKGPISSYTFTSITSDHTIEAVFDQIVLPPSQTVVVLQMGKSTFTVNGSIRALDPPSVIKNGRTLVPIRAIIEALGGTISWDGSARKATVGLGSTTIELWIGRSAAKVDGTSKPIDSTNSKVVPEIINGTTMLPLRFVTESLGATVAWDSGTQRITITYQGT